MSKYIYTYIYMVLVSMEYAFGRVLNPLGACRILYIYIYNVLPVSQVQDSP